MRPRICLRSRRRFGRVQSRFETPQPDCSAHRSRMWRTWSGARVGRRQILAMLTVLTVLVAAAVDLGRPSLVAVGLVGPVLLGLDCAAGCRRR